MRLILDRVSSPPGSYLVGLLLFITACSAVLLFFRAGQPPLLLPGIDVSDNWARHVIDARVRRDHGHALAVSDIDLDGRPDVLIATGTRRHPDPSDGVYWYRMPANPAGARWHRYRVTDPALPVRWSMAVAVGDMDNDGDNDVVALSFNEGFVVLAYNPLAQGGDIRRPWPSRRILTTGGYHRDGERVELVDVDGDGFRDVVFPRGRPATVHVLFNPGAALRAEWVDTVIGPHGGSDAHDVMTVDIDTDGYLDIVVASGDGVTRGAVYWFRNPVIDARAGDWRRFRVSTRAANYGALQIDDVDADGRPDILVAEAHGTPGRVLWFHNPGSETGTWRPATIGAQNFPHAGLLVDVNDDGMLEYWVPDASHDRSGGYGQRTGGIVYFQRGKDPALPWQVFRVAPPGEVGRQARVIDLNNDGDVDVISTADHDAPTHRISLVWWENLGHRNSESATATQVLP